MLIEKGDAMSELPLEAEDVDERRRRAKTRPVQAASDWTKEPASDRLLPFRVRLRLALYLLGLGRGRK
jgi:hypothetical protein